MKKLLLPVIAIIMCNQLHAQIASYSFENNLEDAVANFDLTLVEYAVETATEPTYANGLEGQGVLLDTIQGLRIPAGVVSAFDTASSIELEFSFNITELGDGQGFMYLISNQLGVNSTGISIFIRQDVFSDPDDYEVVFTYADGGFNEGVPDHPGHDETRIGYFLAGDQVELKLILNFATNQWSTLVNNTYTNAFFDAYYDMDRIKRSLLQNQMFIGWGPGQEQDMAFESGVYTSFGIFDELSFYSPTAPGEASLLIDALVALTGHVDGSNPQSTEMLNRHLADLRLNYDGNFAAAETEIYAFIDAYEANYEPVFANRDLVQIGELIPESQALIFVQQALHDEQFVPSNIENMEGVRFEFADVFPGIVAETAPRVDSAVVEINGSYSIILGARIAADLDDAKRPTGYYVAPGEMVTITIPESLVDAGIKAMIGAHDADHSTLTHTNRFVRITKDYPLDNVTTQVASPFGGALFIKIPESSDLGWFDIVIDGAVKAPYFSLRTGRETSPQEWQAQLAAGDVPWVDLESDKYMMTLPLNHVLKLPDPTNLLMQWNDIMDAYNYVGGRPSERTRAEYFLVDSRLPSDAFGTGYPQVIGDNAPYGFLNSTELYPTHVLNPNFYNSGFYITLHEMGHGALHPTLITEVETIIHLNAVYIYNVLYGMSMDSSFIVSSGEFHSMDEATIDWMIADNFRNNRPMDCDPTMEKFVCDELRYQHRGHAKYIEMAELFGWTSVYGMNKAFYDRWSMGSEDYSVTPDLMIDAASQAMGVNMAPLMHFWGLQPSAELAEELAKLPKSMAILEQLKAYKTLAPATAAEFQPWYDRNYPKKDPVHYGRYDAALANYDTENYGADIHAQIDFLITTYFPISSETDIITFELAEQASPAVVDPVNHTIDIEVTQGTDLTSLSPTIALSNGATIDPDGSTVQDFTNPVTYTVTAEDTVTIQDWLVTVTEETSTSLNDEQITSNISIYPNPSNGQFTITSTLNEPYSVKVISIDGRIMYQSTSANRPNLSVDLNVPAAIYVVEIRTADKVGRYLLGIRS